jgi:hypothetical protein
MDDEVALVPCALTVGVQLLDKVKVSRQLHQNELLCNLLNNTRKN